MKKTLIVLGVWIMAIVLIATLVVSMGFSFPEALLIGVLFLPGALAARFFLPKISFEPRKAGIRDSVFVLLAILITETALIVLANLYILRLRKIFLFEYNDYSPTLFNPIFIAGVLTLLVLVDWALKRYLEKSFPVAREPIRFISDRKPVSLLPEEIAISSQTTKKSWFTPRKGAASATRPAFHNGKASSATASSASTAPIWSTAPPSPPSAPTPSPPPAKPSPSPGSTATSWLQPTDPRIPQHAVSNRLIPEPNRSISGSDLSIPDSFRRLYPVSCGRRR
jgi:hypothetical protein